MIEKAHVWEVDGGNFVHTRWCQAVAVSIEAGTIQKPQVYRTPARTAVDLLAQIALGDSQNQFGSVRKGPSILKACAACVEVLAEQEREDLP